MVRCTCCNEEFEEDEIRQRSDNVGEFWGQAAYMNVDVCPYCGSEDLEEVVEE